MLSSPTIGDWVLTQYVAAVVVSGPKWTVRRKNEGENQRPDFLHLLGRLYTTEIMFQARNDRSLCPARYMRSKLRAPYAKTVNQASK